MLLSGSVELNFPWLRGPEYPGRHRRCFAATGDARFRGHLGIGGSSPDVCTSMTCVPVVARSTSCMRGHSHSSLGMWMAAQELSIVLPDKQHFIGAVLTFECGTYSRVLPTGTTSSTINVRIV